MVEGAHLCRSSARSTTAAHPTRPSSPFQCLGITQHMQEQSPSPAEAPLHKSKPVPYTLLVLGVGSSKHQVVQDVGKLYILNLNLAQGTPTP